MSNEGLTPYITTDNPIVRHTCSASLILLYFSRDFTFHLVVIVLFYMLPLLTPLLIFVVVFCCMIDMNVEGMVFIILMSHAMQSLMAEQTKIVIFNIAI